ncbi:MAG: hypothetical protein Q8O72_04810 [Bacteroidales bacterium]|nr:hypothetical protein [Bacteroidales bacterium]
MPIDFFKEGCKTTSGKSIFGLCDDLPPASNPAYIDENNSNIWIAKVHNPTKKPIDFYAIDHCVKLLRADGKQAKSCDGVLKYKDNLIFVELKSRKMKGGVWLTDGATQIKATVFKFKENYDINTFGNVKAYVCNSLKPYANQGHSSKIQMFKDETGLILRVQQKIEV